MRTSQLLSVTALVMTSALQAQAACFNFVNGNGPTRIGNVSLYGPASEICVQQVDRFTANSAAVVLNDAEGALAQFSAEVTGTGRCLGYCRDMQLGFGNSNGQNVSAQGTRLTFQVEPDHRLGITKGTLTITNPAGGSERYLVSGKN